MPFIESGVGSKTYVAPRSKPQQAADGSSYTQGANYGNTGINEALTSGPVASRIAQLEAANPGMNLRQRLTAGARDAITGLLGNARTGGRFDVNVPYYRDAVLQRIESDATSAAQLAAAGREKAAARQAAAAAAGGAAGRQLTGIPGDPVLPSSMSRGSFTGSDGVRHDMAVPTAGNYVDGTYDNQLLQLQRQGLAPGDNNYQAVVGAIQRRGIQAEQYRQAQLEAQRNFELNKALLPAQAKAAGQAGAAAGKAKSKAEAAELERRKKLDEKRDSAGSEVSKIFSKYRGGIAGRSDYFDKPTGTMKNASFDEVNSGNINRGVPPLPGSWGRTLNGGKSKIVQLPENPQMLADEGFYKYMVGKIAQSGKSQEERSFMIQEMDKMMRSAGVTPYWAKPSGAGRPQPMPNSAAAPAAAPATAPPSAQPSVQPNAPQVAPAPQEMRVEGAVQFPPNVTNFIKADPESAKFVQSNLALGVAGITSRAQRAGWSPEEISAAISYAKALGAR